MSDAELTAEWRARFLPDLCAEDAALLEGAAAAGPENLRGLLAGILPRPQILPVVAWAVLTVTAGIVSPWLTYYGRPGGYGLLFAPPDGCARIDAVRLLVEWVLIAVIFGGAEIVGRRRR